MENEKTPDFGHGKICYIEMPAINVEASSAFYEKTFGWKVRKRSDGSTAFDDGVGQVSGTWIAGRKPSTDTSSEIGMLISIMVDDAVATLDQIVANGGKIVQPIGRDLPEITAHFSDPAGNILGIYQHRG